MKNNIRSPKLMINQSMAKCSSGYNSRHQLFFVVTLLSPNIHPYFFGVYPLQATNAPAHPNVTWVAVQEVNIPKTVAPPYSCNC